MASDGYLFGLAIDNRTSGARIRIDRPTVKVQTWVPEDHFPITIKVNQEGRIGVSLYAGIMHNAGADNLVMPVSVTSGGTTASGTLRIFTAGGTHYPDYIVTELNVGEMRLSAQHYVSGLDGFTAGVLGPTPVGEATLIFSDLGAHASTHAMEVGVIEAVKLAVAVVAA